MYAPTSGHRLASLLIIGQGTFETPDARNSKSNALDNINVLIFRFLVSVYDLVGPLTCYCIYANAYYIQARLEVHTSIISNAFVDFNIQIGTTSWCEKLIKLRY